MNQDTPTLFMAANVQGQEKENEPGHQVSLFFPMNTVQQYLLIAEHYFVIDEDHFDHLEQSYQQGPRICH